MTANGEEENFNQHRRPSLERLDEIRHRQDGLGASVKRGNGGCPSGVYGKTWVACSSMLEHARTCSSRVTPTAI